MSRSERIQKRNENLVKDFNHLFNVKRKRLDDVQKELAEKYFLQEDTVYSLVFYNKQNFALYNQLMAERETRPVPPS